MGGTVYLDSQIRRPFANVAAGTTDAEIFPAQSGYRLRVLAVMAVGPTATPLTFNRKPSGSGVAVSHTMTAANGTPDLLPYNPAGWFDTYLGEGLTVTTGAGGTLGILVTLAVVGGAEGVYDELGQLLLLEDGTPLLSEAA